MSLVGCWLLADGWVLGNARVVSGVRHAETSGSARSLECGYQFATENKGLGPGLAG